MAELTTDVRYIKGIGEQRAKHLGRLGIRTLRDLISYFPRAYEDRSVITPISMVIPGENVCICAMVSAAPNLSRVRRGMDLVKLRVVDESGAADITFFNQSYVKDSLEPGQTYIFYGKAGVAGTRRTFTNPLFEREDKKGSVTGRIVPIYRLTAGISQKVLQTAIRHGLDECIGILPDPLPAPVCAEYQLSQVNYAYENIHFPADFGALELARRRLIFEELFVLSCALSMMKNRRTSGDGVAFSHFEMSEFYARLPFAPTAAQTRAIEQALEDMCSGLPMNRLIQGDVGSGKTLIAAACVWFAWKNGYQSAFMAPTEILADQHFDTFTSFLAPFGIKVEKLTGSMTAKQKRDIYEKLSLGLADLVVGTHAIISDSVAFSDLALVIADEQHRFGVDQRAALSAKGKKPHVLIMSATPIPRTLALIIYGELDVSVIDELPPGRAPVQTFAVDDSMRERINKFIRRLVSEGRQVFIVCPMVDENEELPEDLKSAEDHARKLQAEVFPDLRVGCVHGKMKPRAKDGMMREFVAGNIDVLVATTVIEVGVDVPNAALMVVENAERFGLSQLHQLRGRVGRGRHQSYCVLFSNSAGSAKARLKVMCETNDGFKISEADLKMRGPGDFFGSRQHGLPEMHIADLCADMDVLQAAQNAAKELAASDPEFSAPECTALRERINELFQLQGERFN